jgi:hypothetical protein
MEVRVMSFERCFKFAGVVAVGGLLTLAEVTAQQPTISDTVLTKPIHSGHKAKTPPQPGPPEALVLPDAKQLTPLDQAYLDAFTILKEDNTCSAFYGGPTAIEVLNQLKEQLQPRYFVNTIVGVRMTGQIVTVISLRYPQTSYRLFEKAELNLDGPFYRLDAFHLYKSIGGFRPATREARVTMLLHELGHLIQKPAKHWLLPGDGDNENLSDDNTQRVISVCGKQIRSLRHVTFAQELETARLTTRPR